MPSATKKPPANCEAAREIAPKNVMGVYLQALLELRMGNNKAALESVYRALEIAPRHVPSTLLGGVAELALGHPEAAEKFLNTALDLNPRNVYGRKVLAASQMQRKQFAQAIATLEPVLDQGPGASDPELLALAGEAFMQNGQFAKATQYFEKAVALDPQNAAARISLGMSRMASGATDRAIADLEAAAALGPAGARADIMLAMMSLRRKEFDQALRTIAKLEKTQPDNTLVINMKAAAYAGKGDMAQARAQFERALKIDPAYFPAAANLAQLDLQAGNPQAARGRYEGVLQKDKTQTQAMLALADLASRTPGHEKEALDWIQRAKAASPDAIAPFRAEIDHYRRTGQLDKALALALEQKRAASRRSGGAGNARQAAGREGTDGGCGRGLRRTGDPPAEFPDGATGACRRCNWRRRTPGPPATLCARCCGSSPAIPKRRRRWWPRNWPRTVRCGLCRWRGRSKTTCPRRPWATCSRGTCWSRKRSTLRPQRSTRRLTRCARAGSSPSRLYDAWVEAGKPEQGEARIKEWLAEQPGDIATRRHLAYSRLQRGKYALAIEQYRLVLERQPKDP